MKMADNRNDSSLPVFIDASGEVYYQENQVAKKLGGRQRFQGLFRRHATPEEIPILKSLGMRPCYRSEKRGTITLLRAKEVHQMLEQRNEEYKTVPRSKKRLFRAGSDETITTPTSNESERPPFTFVQLVSQALLSLGNDGVSSRKIMNWISDKYPYYRSERFRSSRSISVVLSSYKFFTTKKRSCSMWRIVQEHETRLRENAYLPQKISDGRFKFTSGLQRAEGNVERTSYGRFKSPSKPKVLDRINTADETALKASTSQNIQPEVLDTSIIIDLVEDDVPEAFNASDPLRIEPEVLDIIDLVEDDVTAVNTQKIKPPEVLCTIDLVETDTTEKIKPEILDTINLIEDDETTTVNSHSSKEIKPKVDIIDLVEGDENEFKCEVINTTHQLEYKNNPITFATTHDSMNPSLAGNIDTHCPICDAQFRTKEALGEHVGTHIRVPSTDANEIAKEALQNLTSFLGGRNPESPIFVFSGNVFYTGKKPDVPTS